MSVLPDKLGIVHKFPQFNEIVLVPIYDEHIGAKNHLDPRWRTIKNFLLDNENAFCTIGGDMMNNSILNSKGNPYQDILKPSEQKEWLYEELKPLAEQNKILCMLPGNHERRSEREVDSNPLYDVACRLRIENLYRNVRCYTKIVVGTDKSHTAAFMGVNIHGSYGGKTAGAVMTQLERLAGDFGNIDYIIAGHAHKGCIARPQKFIINPYNNTVSQKDIVVLAATSGVGYEDYAASKNYTPASNEPQYIILKQDRTKPDMKRIQTIWG